MKIIKNEERKLEMLSIRNRNNQFNCYTVVHLKIVKSSPRMMKLLYLFRKVKMASFDIIP